MSWSYSKTDTAAILTVDLRNWKPSVLFGLKAPELYVANQFKDMALAATYNAPPDQIFKVEASGSETGGNVNTAHVAIEPQ